MSIIAYPLEATEYTAEDAQSYLSTRTSGVYSEEIILTPQGMTATIKPFLAWFNYAKFKGCSVAVTEPVTLTFSPAAAALDRIDRVVLRLDLSLNKAYLTILEGVASSVPVPPKITRTEAVYDISPFYVKIKAGATEITHADITSTILDKKVCGIMRDGVTGIPTSQLQKQAEDLILRLHEAINDVESNSAFMFQDLYDPQKKCKEVAFKDETLSSSEGGTIEGDVTIRKATPIFKLENTNAPKGYAVTVEHFAGGGGGVYLLVDANTYSGLRFNPVTADGEITGDEFWFNVKGTNYKAYGGHNKPSGSYPGNGTARSLNIGGNGNVLMISSAYGVLFVTSKGGVGFKREIEYPAVQYEKWKVKYDSGTLEIGALDSLFNAANTTYYYQVL